MVSGGHFRKLKRLWKPVPQQADRERKIVVGQVEYKCRALASVLTFRPARVNGVGEAMERVCSYRSLYEHVAVRALSRGSRMIGEFFLNLSKARLLILVRSAQNPLFRMIVGPEHPRALGAGRRGRGEQGQRADHGGPS